MAKYFVISLISPGMAILLVSVIFLSFNKIKLDHKILGSKIKVALSSLFYLFY